MEQRPSDESETLKQIGEMWDDAVAELGRLLRVTEQAVELSKAQSDLTAIRTIREAALLKLGEAFFRLVDGGQIAAPAALKRLIGDARAKDVEFKRQQADIAAILAEAESVAEARKKKRTR